MVMNMPANIGAAGDMSLIPGSGGSSGGEHGNSLQYSCLENPVNRGAWRATVGGVTKGPHMTEQLSTCVNKSLTKFIQQLN